MTKTNKKRNNKGFSLVELIIVIAIMAVLIGVLAPQFLGYVQKSKKSTDMQNAQQIASEIAIKIADQDAYGTGTGTAIVTGEWTKVSTTYVSSEPKVQLDKDNFFWYKVDANKIVHIEISKEKPANDNSEVYPTVKNSDYTS